MSSNAIVPPAPADHSPMSGRDPQRTPQAVVLQTEVSIGWGLWATRTEQEHHAQLVLRPEQTGSTAAGLLT
jgi:hypothetical protein